VEQDTAATVMAWQCARDDVIDPSITEYEGRLVKLTGDGFLAEFPTVENAVNCAIVMQEALLPSPLRFRMGVSIGDIIDDGRDIHGEGINIAARLESIADPGGILVSGDVFNLVRNRIDEEFLDLGRQTVKHVSQPVAIYALARFSREQQGGRPQRGSAAQLLSAGTRARRMLSSPATAGAVVVVLLAGGWLYESTRDRSTQGVPPHLSDTAFSNDGTMATEVPNTASVATKDRSLSPGDSFRDCPSCPTMTVVPAGSFKMGWDDGDPDEKPVVDVTIPENLAVGRYEITFDQWDACVAENGCDSYRPDDRGWGRENRPVIYVSWFDAQAYTVWLGKKTGKEYRLLTEAEWEYVARGGSSELYPWGVTIDAAKANYGLFRGKTIPIGSYEANGFGLFDVVGNVWEWVIDCYAKNAYSVHRGYPRGYVENGETCRRVVRGGSWNTDTSDGPNLMRSSIRWKGKANGRYNHFGFRVARNLE
jgi:formylglycine-generating enzyme required for sulfatase activity